MPVAWTPSSCLTPLPRYCKMGRSPWGHRTRPPVALGPSSKARVGHPNSFRVVGDPLLARHVACSEWVAAQTGCGLQRHSAVPCFRGTIVASCPSLPLPYPHPPLPTSIAPVAQPTAWAPQLAIGAPGIAVLCRGGSSLCCERRKHRQGGDDRPGSWWRRRRRRRRRHAAQTADRDHGFGLSKAIVDARTSALSSETAAPKLRHPLTHGSPADTCNLHFESTH